MDNRVTLRESIDTFSMYMYRANKSESTKTAYMADLNYFYTFAKNNLNNKIRYADQITLTEIRQYKDYLLEKFSKDEIKRATVDRIKCTL